MQEFGAVSIAVSGYLSDVVKPQTEEVSHDRTTSEDDQGHRVEESLPIPQRAYLAAVTGLARHYRE